MPRISDTSQPAPASFAVRPRTVSGSISIPAMKKRNARPKSESVSSTASGCARSSTWGPTMIPARISVTTIGTRTRDGKSASSGASAATASTTTTVSREMSTRSASARGEGQVSAHAGSLARSGEGRC